MRFGSQKRKTNQRLFKSSIFKIAIHISLVGHEINLMGHNQILLMEWNRLE